VDPVPPVEPLLVPPTPGLLGEVVLPVPPPAPVPEVLPVPEELLPTPELLLPVLPLRSWRMQSSLAMPDSTSQRLELELAPLLLGLALGLLLLGLLLLGLLLLGLLGLVLGLVELLPLGLLDVWATATLAAPRNAADKAAQSTFIFISAPKGDGKGLPSTWKQLLCPRRVFTGSRFRELPVMFVF
jgi:hypothetical protein